MQENKSVREYTIKEIYENYNVLEERYYNILNVVDSFAIVASNDFYSKLKFVKYLKEYKNAVDFMPVINKQLDVPEQVYTFSDLMVEIILYYYKNARTEDIEETVKFDKESQTVIFNKNSFEKDVFQKMILNFTELILEDNNNYKGLYKARVEYMTSKLINITNYKDYNSDNEFRTERVKLYEKLVDVFGEEFMVLFDFSNLAKLSLSFEEHNEILEEFDKKYIKLYDDNISIVEKNKILTIMNERLAELQNRDNKENRELNSLSVETEEGINKFIEILLSEDEFPEKIKLQMIKNLKNGVNNIEVTKIDKRHYAYYDFNKKEVKIRKNLMQNKAEKQETVIHELFHAATTSRNRFDEVNNVGFVSKTYGMGYGLNEGATEYFSQKLFRKISDKKIPVSYKELVAVIEDLVNLYGENVILDAMVNGTSKLEGLMEEDGVNFAELREDMDGYYRYVYCDKEKEVHKMIKENLAKAKYLKIGNFIEKIKTNRNFKIVEENPLKSEWKECMNLFKGKERFLGIKRFFSNIKDSFIVGKDLELLSESFESQNTNVLEQGELFRKQIVVDEMKLQSGLENLNSKEKCKENYIEK